MFYRKISIVILIYLFASVTCICLLASQVFAQSESPAFVTSSYSSGLPVARLPHGQGQPGNIITTLVEGISSLFTPSQDFMAGVLALNKSDPEKLKIKEIQPGKFSFKTLSSDLIEIREENHQPSLKLNKWDTEVTLKIAVPYARDGQKSLTQNHLKWSNPKYEVDFYPKAPEKITETIQGRTHKFTMNEEGGVEFDLILKERPKSNVFTFPIETKGLKFYYQPALHPEHPTWADSNKDGIADTFGPENVVGSYAVYHATQDKMFKTEEEGKKYKTGKAFHIYRPKIIDNAGNWIWGELNIDKEKKTLTITIDQNWLDNAVYPVVIDPDFGYTSKGAQQQEIAAIKGAKGTPPSSGTANSITAWLSSGWSDSTVQGSLYEGINRADPQTESKNAPYVPVGLEEELTLNFTGGPNVTASTQYYVSLRHTATNDANIAFDSVTDQGMICFPGSSWVAVLNVTNCSDALDLDDDEKFSVYCTYTAAGPSTSDFKFDGTIKMQGVKISQ